MPNHPQEPIPTPPEGDEPPSASTAEAAPESVSESTPESTPESTAGPIGLVAPEWALQHSARGAALWRHAGVMCASAKENVEVLALDHEGRSRRFSFRDQWNVPAPGARFRVRRVLAGGRTAAFGDLDRARLEGVVLEWVRVRRPRLVHVLDIDVFGLGLLFALEAAELPVILTLQRMDDLRRAMNDPEALAVMEQALRSVRRIVVRSAADASVAQACGAPRETIRVMAGGPKGESAVLRSYASLYRLLAPQGDAAVA